MMVHEDEYFIINYTEQDRLYIDKVLSHLNNKYDEYRQFFSVEELPFKVHFILYDNIDLFRAEMKRKYGHVRETTVGHACGSLVEILTLSERKKVKNQENSTEETIIMTFAHELLHIFHAFYKGNNNGTWFAEGLAINLGSPRYELGLIDCTPTDLINKSGKSRHYYAMVKYMLKNMSHEEILEYAKNDDMVMEHTEEIYTLANEWIKNKNRSL